MENIFWEKPSKKCVIFQRWLICSRTPGVRINSEMIGIYRSRIRGLECPITSSRIKNRHIPVAMRIVVHCWPVMPIVAPLLVVHFCPIVPHCCPLLPHCCPLLPHCCPIVAHCCPLFPYCSPLLPIVVRCCPLLPHCCPLLSVVAHCCPIVAHCFPLFSHCSPLFPIVVHHCPSLPIVAHCYPIVTPKKVPLNHSSS